MTPRGAVRQNQSFPELNGVREISRKETREGHFVSVEFVYEAEDGLQSIYMWNGMDHEDVPESLDEAINGMGDLLPIVPGGEC